MDVDLIARLRWAMAALEAKKAFHILALDVSSKTSIADVFMFCSVGSQRQAQAVSDEVLRVLRVEGAKPLSVEGYSQGTWVLLDYGDFVLHVFDEQRREYYSLDRLWGDAPAITEGLTPAPP